MSMTVAQLRTIERCYGRAMRVLTRALVSGHPRLVAAEKAWNEAYVEFKAAERAQAARKDKGEVLWTLCVPSRTCVRETSRTLLRRAETRHYELQECPYRPHSIVRSVDWASAEVRTHRLYGSPWVELEKEWERARASAGPYGGRNRYDYD